MMRRCLRVRASSVLLLSLLLPLDMQVSGQLSAGNNAGRDDRAETETAGEKKLNGRIWACALNELESVQTYAPRFVFLNAHTVGFNRVQFIGTHGKCSKRREITYSQIQLFYYFLRTTGPGYSRY